MKRWNQTQCLRIAVAAGLAALISGAQARDALFDNLFHYKIGGGRPLKPTTTTTPNFSYNASLSFNPSGSGCSTKFDPEALLDIQFDTSQIQDGFMSMLNSVTGSISSMISNAPFIILQRTHPELYDVTIQGFENFQDELQFFTASCEDMVNAVADRSFPADKLVKFSGFEALRQRMDTAAGDIKSAMQEVEQEAGEAGVKAAGDVSKGGAGQDPLEVVKEVARTGFNMQFPNRAVTSTSSVPSSSGNNQALWNAWQSPQQATDWLIDVLGETTLRTCDGCQKTQTKPGKGLVFTYNSEYETAYTDMATLVALNRHLTAAELESISSSTVRITQPLIDALRAVGDTSTIERLASEVGLSRTLEKAILARRLLVAGRKEANLANNEVLQEETDRKLADLDTEIDNIMLELEVRTKLNTNTPQKLLEAYAMLQKQGTPTAPINPALPLRSDGAIEQ